MKCVVHKYRLPRPSAHCTPSTVTLPDPCTILHVGVQLGELFLWALRPSVVTAARERVFLVVGTGWPFDGDAGYLFTGTIQDGGFVWHVFEKVAP